LILLAPALSRPAFADQPPVPVDVPVVVYHGIHDTVVPLQPVRDLATRTFPRLTFHAVDDDHRLAATVQTIDWPALLGYSGSA
jgi:surfactin synthase thioesterase subunit